MNTKISYFILSSVMMVIALGGCAQQSVEPPLSSSTTAGDYSGFSGDAAQVAQRIVDKVCAKGNDQDSDQDGLCDSTEDPSCVGKNDCDGNGIADGDENENLSKNPFAVAVSSLAGQAANQALDDPESPTPDVATSLDQTISISFSTSVNNGKSAVRGFTSPVSVEIRGGKVTDKPGAKIMFSDLDSPVQDKKKMQIYMTTYYDKPLIIEGETFGYELRVLQCVGSYKTGTLNYGLYYPRKVEKAQDLESQYMDGVFDDEESCDGTNCTVSASSNPNDCDGKLGLYVGFVSKDGDTVRTYTQHPSVSGYSRATDTAFCSPNCYGGYVKFEVDPAETGDDFVAFRIAPAKTAKKTRAFHIKNPETRAKQATETGWDVVKGYFNAVHDKAMTVENFIDNYILSAGSYTGPAIFVAASAAKVYTEVVQIGATASNYVVGGLEELWNSAKDLVAGL